MPTKLDLDTDTIRIQFAAPKSWFDRVDTWRKAQWPVPNKTAAIRRLVEVGLDIERRRAVMRRAIVSGRDVSSEPDQSGFDGPIEVLHSLDEPDATLQTESVPSKDDGTDAG